MRRRWWGRWTGAACAVAGCMPMLFGIVAGGLGAAGAQGMDTMGMMPMGMQPGWVTLLGRVSWPLLIVSAGLLVWSFWRTSAVARRVAYAGVALLIVNQLNMTPWLFFPALALLAGGFVLARSGAGAAPRGIPSPSVR